MAVGTGLYLHSIWYGCTMRPNGLPISRAPARATLIDQESIPQKTLDLDRTGRGVGCMGGLAGGFAVGISARNYES